MLFRSFGRSLLAVAWLGTTLLFLAPATKAADPAPYAKGPTVEGITEYTLPNGLRVLLFPDPSKPVVTVNMTVFVGSRHEGYGETGMAHLLEHMLFKGTPTYPKIPKALSDHGARDFNGTTWVDRTNYYETLPATEANLEFAIHLEADRLVNSFVKREDLVSEMTVVRNEFEMGENSPDSILSQRMMAVAFEWHNYGKSTIGNRADIERVPIENLQAFYRKYYRVDNSMLIVAGKFDEKKTLELIVKYFGLLKKPETPIPSTYTEEPAQDGERTVVLRRVGTVGIAGVVYHVPAAAHPDFAAVQVLEDCLTSDPAGRLYKALVEGKKASSVSGATYGWHDPGVIEISAKAEGTDPVPTREAMLAAIDNLAKEPITAAEVERSKTRYNKLNEQLLSNSSRLAIRLSEWAACGDWRLFFLDRDRVEKVTAEDVNRVAGKYLSRANRTVGLYYPTKQAERADVPETPKVAELVKDYKGRTAVAVGEAFDPTPANIEQRVQRGQIEGVKTALLPKKTRGEMVELRLNLRFGNAEALKGLTTAASAVGDMLMRGTKKHTKQQLTDALDKLGARLTVNTDSGKLTATLRVKKPNLAEALSLFGEVLREPSFPATEFDILKRENREQLNAGKTEPQMLAFYELERKLHPYAKDDVRYTPSIDESLELIEALKLDDVRKVYESMIGAHAGELAVVGDFDPEAVKAALAGILKGWKAPVEYKRIEKPAQTDLKGGKDVIQTPDKANAVYAAGLLYPLNDSDPDYPALLVGNYMLGGAPLASRLSNRVRGEQGLSYGIGSGFRADPIDKLGRFTFYAITNPVNMSKVEGLIAEEIDKFIKNGPSLAELEEGKKAFTEQLRVQRTEDGVLATQLMTGLQVGRTYAFYTELEKNILGLKLNDVHGIFKKVLDPKKIIIVEAGDFKKK